MFRVKVNNTFLEITDANIRYEMINNAFEADAFQGDYSFPFTFKATDVNLLALGFSNMIEVPNKKLEYQAEIFYGTHLLQSGRLIVKVGGHNYFNANIAAGIRSLSNADKSLKELNYLPDDNGQITIGSLLTPSEYQYVNWELMLAFPPHYNPDFYGDANTDFNGVVNRMDATMGSFPVNDALTVGNKYAMVPFFYFHYILHQIFKENGLTPSGSYWENTDMAALLMYNNYALDKKKEQGCTVIVEEDTGFNLTLVPGDGEWLTAFSDTISGAIDEENNWDNTLQKYVIPANGDYSFRFTGNLYGWNVSTGLPGAGTVKVCIYKQAGAVYTLIDSVMVEVTASNTTAFELQAVAPGSNAGEYILIRVENGSADGDSDGYLDYDCDFVFKAGAPLIISKYDDGEQNEMTNIITVKNHVWDVTVSEFLAMIKKRWGVKFSFDWTNSKVSVDFIKTSISKTPQLDLTDKSSYEYEISLEEQNNGYTIGDDFGSSDASFETQPLKPYDEDKLIGLYDRIEDLPTPALVEDVAIVKNINSVYKTQLNSTSGLLEWVFYSFNHYDIVVGDGKTEVRNEIAPMLMTLDQTNESATSNADHMKCLMPMIKERGSSPMFDLGINEPSYRCVFMRGKNQTTAVGGNYIYAGVSNIDLNGNYVGNGHLKLNDTDGVFALFLKKLYQALTTSEIVERDLDADIVLITNPKLQEPVIIKHVPFILKSLTIVIGNTIKTSRAKWLKL